MTHLQRLANAYGRHRRAQEDCPHWDYETAWDEGVHDCCHELADSQHELITARRAARKAEGKDSD